MDIETQLINSLEQKEIRYNIYNSLRQLEEKYKGSCEDSRFFILIIRLIQAHLGNTEQGWNDLI